MSFVRINRLYFFVNYRLRNQSSGQFGRGPRLLSKWWRNISTGFAFIKDDNQYTGTIFASCVHIHSAGSIATSSTTGTTLAYNAHTMNNDVRLTPYDPAYKYHPPVVIRPHNVQCTTISVILTSQCTLYTVHCTLYYPVWRYTHTNRTYSLTYDIQCTSYNPHRESRTPRVQNIRVFIIPITITYTRNWRSLVVDHLTPEIAIA